MGGQEVRLARHFSVKMIVSNRREIATRVMLGSQGRGVRFKTSFSLSLEFGHSAI